VVLRQVTTLLISGLLLTASSSQERPHPNILLITVDTLRADRVGAYGYALARTPALDRLAAEGVRFADATAHAPLTLPAHAALLTGRYPGAFGIRVNGMGAVPPEVSTVAERLEATGYRTAAVVASAVLGRGYGLDQGFDQYDDRIPTGASDTVSVAELQRTADSVTVAARAWLAAQSGPWFLWVHYYDPHLPYAAPATFRALAPGRPYDAEIAFVDSEIAALLSAIDRSRTVVIATADHGEALGDHGEPDHGFFLYDATLRVPLIVAAPGLAPRVVVQQVRHVDLPPTILELAGVGAAAPRDTDGESLVSLMKGATRREVPASYAESWYPRYHFGWSELRAVRVGEWKYIAAPAPELYDLRTDRAEALNVLGQRTAVAGRLAAELEQIASGLARQPSTRVEQPDPAAVARLQALGYLGTFAPATTGAATNPRDRIEDYRQYRELFNRALSLLAKTRAAEAATVLQQLVKRNVRAFEAHLYLGNAYAALGKAQAALGEYDAATQLNPALATPHIEAAKVLSSANDHAAAILRGRRAIELAPNSDYVHYTVGAVYRKAGRWAEAADALLRAVELNPANVRARAALGSVAMRLDRLDVAEQQFAEMVRLGYQVAPAQYNLGVIAVRRGDRAEAARRFRQALDADPGFKPAREALAKIR
jgi:arylsulfatase A-like enzyme/Tfp pilus assembly protein PilF